MGYRVFSLFHCWALSSATALARLTYIRLVASGQAQSDCSLDGINAYTGTGTAIKRIVRIHCQALIRSVHFGVFQ